MAVPSNSRQIMDPAGRAESWVSADQESFGSASGRSLDEELNDFIAPRISDLSLLQGGGAMAVLENFLAEGLPGLEGAAELRSLAMAVISDEISRHRAILDRRHHGIAA
jgi:hypothetical protein